MSDHLPTPPDGWHLIAPIEAAAGDGILLPDGSVVDLDERVFEPFPVELRRQSWALRKDAPDEQARINADLGIRGGFNGPPLPDGTDKFLSTQQPDVTPVDDLSRFVLARIIELELEPRGEIDVFKNPEQAMAYRYAKHVRDDCVVFRGVVAMYCGATHTGRPGLFAALVLLANRWAGHHEFRDEWRLT